MSKEDGRMYLACRLVRESESSLGLPIRIADDQCAGAMFVFWSREAAQEVYGDDVTLLVIEADNE